MRCGDNIATVGLPPIFAGMIILIFMPFFLRTAVQLIAYCFAVIAFGIFSYYIFRIIMLNKRKRNSEVKNERR